MDKRPCALCRRETAKVLSPMSPDPDVTYYRCEECGHVWVTFADGRPVHHVTPLERPNNPE